MSVKFHVCESVCLHMIFSIQAGLVFSLVCKEENLRDTFEEEFRLWARAIITHSRDTQIRYSALQTETADYSEDLDDGKQSTAHTYCVCACACACV